MLVNKNPAPIWGGSLGLLGIGIQCEVVCRKLLDQLEEFQKSRFFQRRETVDGSVVYEDVSGAVSGGINMADNIVVGFSVIARAGAVYQIFEWIRGAVRGFGGGCIDAQMNGKGGDRLKISGQFQGAFQNVSFLPKR